MGNIKSIIGVSTRIVKALNYDEKRDAISHDLIAILDKLGFYPILIPNNLSNILDFLEQFPFSGFIISGGDNIGDFPERDNTERKILEYVSKKNIPTLGICRGMQLINDFFGGKIYVDKLHSHVNVNHSLKIIDKKFQGIFNNELIDVNSYHNNIIKSENLGLNLIPFAVYDDGSIEGFFHTDLSIYGIMWHPERSSSKTSISLIKAIFSTELD